MKCSKSCGLPFKAWVAVEFGLEVICSGLIGAACFYSWIESGKPTNFIYTPQHGDNYVKRNTALEGCVIVWILSVLCLISAWRILSAFCLVTSVKKNSVGLGQYWLIYKMTVLVCGIFVATASFNAPVTKIPGILSFIVDIVTSYFVMIFLPELDRMARTVMVSDSKKVLNDQNL